MSRSIWKFLTSLRLTVVLLALGILIVFFGTLAQVNEGLWQAQERWFQSAVIYWRPPGAHWRVPVFPGGYTLGFALLVNLLAAHIHRFHWSWRKLGIHLTHAGIILLLVGELAKDNLQREGTMSFREGETKNYSQSQRETELVFTSDFEGKERVVSIRGDLVQNGKEIKDSQLPCTVRVVRFQPNSDVFAQTTVAEALGTLTTAIATMEAKYSALETLPDQAAEAQQSSGRTEVFSDALKAVGEKDPRDLVAATKKVIADPKRGQQLSDELKRGFRKSMLSVFVQRAQSGRVDEKGAAAGRLAERMLAGQPVTPDAFPKLATKGDATAETVFDLPETLEMDKSNIPYAVIELLQGGQSLGTWLVSPVLRAQALTLGGQSFRVALRFQRYYQPFSLTLLKTTHEIYPGTATEQNPEGIPKNYQSRVRVSNSETGEQREVDIYMNNPLRYGGLTFYQYQMGQDEAAGVIKNTSSLQVVKNPSWLAPYIGCIVVGVGMVYQFLIHLVAFLGKRKAPPAAPTPSRSSSKRSPVPEPASV